MKKLSNYKKQKISENLEYFFNKVSEDDYNEGLVWYQTANDIVQNLSKKYNFQPLVVANVLSALSPRNKWERNIFDTEQVLKAVNEGKDHDSVKVCTFNNNKIKAFELAQGNREGIEYSKSPKTHSFVRNIAELNENFVTVGNTKTSNKVVMSAKNCNVFYGNDQALKNINIEVGRSEVLALIGPSGCGKSTFLRCLNRLNDTIDTCRVSGQISLEGEDIYSGGMDVVLLRARVGMVFQKPNPFPKSIYENVAYGLRVRGEKNKRVLDDKVEEALKGASLWDEVKKRLHDLAFNLSGGQQQRLCIARALATDPEIMLFDEPTSALDPIATMNIEELMAGLKEKLSILIVTHNMQQAARISDYTAYMYLGELVEHDETDKVFTNPSKKETEDYITGKFG